MKREGSKEKSSPSGWSHGFKLSTVWLVNERHSGCGLNLVHVKLLHVPVPS
jgi:hypothetical protein